MIASDLTNYAAQAFGDEALRNMGHRVARNNALSLANEANRRPGGITSMSLDEAEAFAAEADKFDADLDYLEAATKDSAEASTQGPVVEDSPHVLQEVKNIKKKKATRKMKSKSKSAGLAAAVEQAVQEGRLQEQPAEPEATDVVCPFSFFICNPQVVLEWRKADSVFISLRKRGTSLP